MGWKCAPQLTGLVRGEPKANAKHRSNAKAICAEAGKERITNSQTIDRSRSYLNRYKGIESGFACADDMTDRANAYRQQVKGKGGSVMQRALRGDAVIGCAIIYNPPEEVCRDWTDEQYAKFYKDSDDFMHELCPSIFREENVLMDAEHFDEGTIADPKAISRHRHRILDCIDEDGKYCGNLIDAHLVDTINRKYPAFMRSRGWEMDDLDVTDWEKAKTDKEYREQRKAKRKKSGKDVNDYIAGKLQETLETNENLTVELSVTLQQVQEKEEELREKEQELQEKEQVLQAKEQRFVASRFKRGFEDICRRLRNLAFEDVLEKDGENIEEERKKLLEGQNTLSETAERMAEKLKTTEDLKHALEVAVDRANRLPEMDEVTQYVLETSLKKDESGKWVKSSDYLESARQRRRNNVYRAVEEAEQDYQQVQEKQDTDEFSL